MSATAGLHQEVTSMVKGLLDGTRVVFGDERAVANAGILLPAVLAERLGIEARVGETVDFGCGRDNPSVGSGLKSTPASGCPPRRSQRAELPHWAPALGDGGESQLGPGMQNPRER